MEPPAIQDPRPRFEDGQLCVISCRTCSWTSVGPGPLCPSCGDAVEPSTIEPVGSVWSATVVHIATPGRLPPYGLAYVDVDAGPRVLAHTAPERLPLGVPVRLRMGTDGDVVAESVTDSAPEVAR